ncbi:MAG: glycosyltransferase family 87 protein [Flavobacteriales bacterium]
MLKEEFIYFWKGARWFALLPVLYLVLLFINHRFQLSDFNVYYGAADALMNGEQVYGKAFGLSSGFYKYSPEILVPFLPFALLKYDVAAVLFYLINTGIILLLLNEFKQTFFKSYEWGKEVWFFLIAAVLFFGDQLERELFLGNVNALLLLLTLWAVRSIENKQHARAGLIYAVVLCFKIHFLILLPYFILKKEWKVLFYTTVGIIGMAITLFICVPNRFVVLHSQWLKAVQAHNVQLDHSPNTIYFFIQRVLSSMHMAVIPIAAVLIGLGIAAVAYLTFIWKKIGMGFQSKEALVLLALIPVLTHTDTEHFLWAMPFFLMMLITISTWNQKGKMFGSAILVLASIPFLFNSPDLVGKSFSKILDEGGIGLSLVLLLLLSLLYRSVKFFRNHLVQVG